jgi:signal transduction histidine kinase
MNPKAAGSKQSGMRTLYIVGGTAAAYALWEVTAHRFLMFLPMQIWHWVSAGVGAVLALTITGVSVHTILRQQRELEALSRLKDNLTAMLVHDLRTPLTAVIGSLETVRAGVLGEVSPEVGEMTDMALDGSRSLLRMVNDLLDIARMEAGEPILDLAESDAALVVSEAVDAVAALARERGIALGSNVAPGIPSVRIDREKVRRVLVNLLGNALKFTPAGGRVDLRASWSGAERQVVFAVSDTGEGIPKAYHQRIFDKFGQVETRKAGRKMGTGLGLTFCKMVAEAHGGLIGVESEVGRGSTITLVIPDARGARPKSVEAGE